MNFKNCLCIFNKLKKQIVKFKKFGTYTAKVIYISTLCLLHYEGDIYFKESFKKLPKHCIYANLSVIVILLRKIGS